MDITSQSVARNSPASVLLLMLLGYAAIVSVGFWSIIHGQATLVVAIFCLAGLLFVSQFNNKAGIYLAIVFLILLGDIRRVCGWLMGFPANDPLILVGIAFVAILALPILIRIRLSEFTSKVCLALMVVMLMQVFNPAQGGVLVGLSGALITLPSLLWYWVGNRYGDEAMVRMLAYKIIVPLAVLASFLGYFQTFVAIPVWQQAWVDHISATYLALHISGSGVRAFGFSTSAAEFVNLLSIASMFCLIAFLTGRRLFAIPLLTLLPAIFIASSRTPILRLLIAGAVGYALLGKKRRNQPVRFAFAISVGIGALAFSLLQHGDYVVPKHGAKQSDYALAHQINGLSHPLDQRYSTAGLKTGEVLQGIRAAIQRPVGYGIGSTTIGAKFSDSGKNIVGSELDLTDSFINLGFPGGFLYLLFIVSALKIGLSYTRKGPKDISVAICAMMFAMLGSWLIPGEYSSGPYFWLLIGCMVRMGSRVPVYVTGTPKQAPTPRFAISTRRGPALPSKTV